MLHPPYPMNLQPYTPDEKRYSNTNMYQRCGKSGIMLPKISLGWWHNFGKENDYDRCREIVRCALDHGITHMDLANNYGPPPGSAEEMMGRMMRDDLKPYRDELFIATKAGYEMWPGPYGNWGSRKSLVASLDQSLGRMKLEYVDLFYTHRYDPETPLEETLQALVDIVRAGKALYIGISRWPLHALRTAVKFLEERDVHPLIYQGRLNMLDHGPVEEGILEECQRSGMGFISFSPLAQGLLTDRYLKGEIPEDSRMHQGRFLKREMLSPEMLSHLRDLDGQARAKGMSLAEMALQWVLEHRGVTSVLVGASSVEQLRKNIGAVLQVQG